MFCTVAIIRQTALCFSSCVLEAACIVTKLKTHKEEVVVGGGRVLVAVDRSLLEDLIKWWSMRVAHKSRQCLNLCLERSLMLPDEVGTDLQEKHRYSYFQMECADERQMFSMRC